MNITKRTVKGSALTHQELDDNFTAIEGGFSSNKTDAINNVLSVYNLDDYRTDESYIGTGSAPSAFAGVDIVGYLPVRKEVGLTLSRTDAGNVSQKVWCFDENKAFLRIIGTSSAATLPTFSLTDADMVDVAFIGFIVNAGSIADYHLTAKVEQALPVPQPIKFLDQQDVVRFSVQVNTVNPLLVPSTSVATAQDSELFETDYGVLMLPTTYANTGEPTRLIIGCHGGGGTVSANGSQTETFSIYKYFVSIGYAVMDMAGMPQSYATRNKIDVNRVMGNYFSTNAYQKGYEWVIENYNIDRDGVFINGGSNGGLTSLNIYSNTNIPVLAMSGMSPLIDLRGNGWELTSPSVSGGWATAYGNRLNIIKIYGMADPTVYEIDGTTVDVAASQANLDVATYEEDKVIGFNPFEDDVDDIGTTPRKKLKVPYKVWQPVDDASVNPASTTAFMDRLKLGGSFAVHRVMASGGHSPETAGATLGTFNYLGATLDLKPAVAECAMWFNRFN